MVKMKIFEKQKSDEKSKKTIDIAEANQCFREKLEKLTQNFNGKELSELIDYAKKLNLQKNN